MQNDVLNLDEFSEDIQFRRASTGQRFGNYIIDLIGFYFVIFLIAMVYFSIFPVISIEEEPTAGMGILENLIILILFAVYMGIQETIMKGRSLGKLITRTRAVNMDGSYISPKTAFLRGFSRSVPFCAFSALGSPCNPWQDRWTHTIVVTN